MFRATNVCICNTFVNPPLWDIGPFPQFVQEAVLQCVQTLSQKEPNTRVALVTFNNEVIVLPSSSAAFQYNMIIASTSTLNSAYCRNY